MKLDGKSPLVSFMKKNGRLDRSYYNFEDISITKSYGVGYTLLFRIPEDIRDAITGQCMDYNMDVYRFLMKELAFLYITTSLESMID